METIKNAKGALETANEFSPHVRVEIGHQSSPATLDTGPLQPTQDGGWTLNPRSTFPLTIEEIDRKTAEQMKGILDEQFKSSVATYLTVDKLVPLIARSNARCREIDQYVKEFKPHYLHMMQVQKQSCGEWASASEKDREDILASFRRVSLESLDVRPSCDLVTLFECEPADATLDDALIDRYGHGTLQLYFRYGDNLHKVRNIPADHHERQGFEKLVTADLAIRGRDIPLELVLETFKLKEMPQIVPEQEFPRFRKKADAIEWLMKLPDMRERVAKVRALRELFQLIPFPENFSHIDIKKISETWRYAGEVALLIAGTYVHGSLEADHKQRQRDLLPYVTGWRILTAGETTCPYCKRLASSVHPQNRRPKVPFHVGCRCTLVSAVT